MISIISLLLYKIKYDVTTMGLKYCFYISILLDKIYYIEVDLTYNLRVYNVGVIVHKLRSVCS